MTERIRAKCRDCNWTGTVYPSAFASRSPARCAQCGGLLDDLDGVMNAFHQARQVRREVFKGQCNTGHTPTKGHRRRGSQNKSK